MLDYECKSFEYFFGICECTNAFGALWKVNLIRVTNLVLSFLFGLQNLNYHSVLVLCTQHIGFSSRSLFFLEFLTP